MPDGCEIANGRAGADLTYLGHGTCTPYWNELSNEHAPPNALREALGL